MCWELPLSSSQHSKKNNMTEDNKDLQIKALVTELNNIKKDFAIKLEEIQALYLEIKQQKSINEDHQKLNGRLRLELEELKSIVLSAYLASMYVLCFVLSFKLAIK